MADGTKFGRICRSALPLRLLKNPTAGMFYRICNPAALPMPFGKREDAQHLLWMLQETHPSQFILIDDNPFPRLSIGMLRRPFLGGDECLCWSYGK